MPAGCNCWPNIVRLRGLWAATACAAVLQSLPVSSHFRGCKAPLSSIVSGAISSELPLPFLPFTDFHPLFSLSRAKYPRRRISAIHQLSRLHATRKNFRFLKLVRLCSGVFLKGSRWMWNRQPVKSTVKFT